jgi:hypothetical protein
MTCSIVPPASLQVGVNVTTNVPASSAPDYSGAVTYTAGTVVIDPATRIEYESLQNSNLGKALTETLWWLPKGVENRARMFDDSIGTQTANDEMIEIVIDYKKVVTTLALMNIVAREVEVIVTDPVEGVKFHQSVRTTEPSGRSWWAWHFRPVVRKDRVLFNSLPLYAQATITVRIKNPGGVAKCGISILGQHIAIGMTQYGASVGFDDYSVKKRDDFGGFIINERAYSDNARFQVFVQDSMVDNVARTLAKYRAKAVLYIGTEELTSTWIFGYFRSFENVFSEYQVSDCSIEVESVT